jgi:hypothetical protein
MILLLLGLDTTASAQPPRGEVILGWAGNLDRGYGFVEGLPSLGRSEDASVVLALSASELYYQYFDGFRNVNVTSPGASIGLGFEYAPDTVSFSLATSFEARRTVRTAEDLEPEEEIQLTAALASNVYWRAGRRTSLYANATFTGANAWFWSRIGGIHQVIPTYRRDTATSLWLGLEASASGNPDTKILDLGAVAELPVRAWHTSFDVRGGLEVVDAGLGVVEGGTVGLGAYIWY